MGRMGVSYLDVANVAFGLQGRGANPTVDAVREVLGTGSRSTIGPYLKQWRNKQEVSNDASGLPPELYSLVKGLYERIQAEANHRVVLEAQCNEGQIEEILQNLALVQTEKDSLSEALKVLEEKLAVVLKDNESLCSELANVKREAAGLMAKVSEQEQRLNDKNKQIQFLEVQLKNVQDAEKETFKREWYEQKARIMEFQEQLNLKDSMIGELKGKYHDVSQYLDQLQKEKMLLLKEGSMLKTELRKLAEVFVVQDQA